jgi:hypothetical protein
MNDRKDLNPPRGPRHREQTFIMLSGFVGLAATLFYACGSDSSNDSTGSRGGSAVDSGAPFSTDGSSSAAEGGVSSCATASGTAANTASVVAAANTLNTLLTSSQQTTIQLAGTLANSEQWSNLPTNFIPRNGVMIGDMSTDAQAAAITLVSTAAGTTGTTLFSEIRAADEWLVTDGRADSNGYGEGRYYVAFVGTPSTTSPWMLQIAGHHLAYNYTYNSKCTSATPLFDGVEPTTWTDSAGTSHAPLESQRAAAVAVIAAISSNSDSLLSGTYTDVVNGPTNSNGLGDTRYPSGLSYPTGTTGRGVLVGSLTTDQQALVKTAIEAWVKNVADPISTALLTDYESSDALASTYVAYSGATDLTTQNSYFRIDGPRVWIEYTIQGGIVYQSRVHYHTIWRDKVADYGAEYADSDAGSGQTTGTEGGMMGMMPFGDGGPGGMPPGFDQ